MHVITKARLREFWEEDPAAQVPLAAWYHKADHATWQNLAEVRVDYSHCDPYGSCFIFNIGGNKYRLIVKMKFQSQMIYVRAVLTHSEYDKEKWKDDC